MSRFFETIKVQNGTIYNLSFHNKRLNNTIMEVFGKDAAIDLKEYIVPPHDSILYRCKVIYDTTVRDVSFYPYQPKKYHRFKCIHCDIDYPYKSTDRTQIDTCFHKKEDANDIIIVKNNLLTDTSIANIALYDGIHWYTPATPLLEGTLRASLLANKCIKPKDLTLHELQSCEKFAVMNAIVGFHELKNISFIY